MHQQKLRLQDQQQRTAQTTSSKAKDIPDYTNSIIMALGRERTEEVKKRKVLSASAISDLPRKPKSRYGRENFGSSQVWEDRT